MNCHQKTIGSLLNYISITFIVTFSNVFFKYNQIYMKLRSFISCLTTSAFACEC